MDRVVIRTPRLLLKDFEAADRAAFVGYQTDPRYLRLYDFPEGDTARADRLFDRFLDWQREQPRRSLQLGVFDRTTGRLLGCAGLRRADEASAVLGLELAPAEWGRFRLAIDIATALIDYGFGTLQLQDIKGDTASGNRRVEKLARWFGAKIVARRTGPAWMQGRGWQEVDWALSREDWERSRGRVRRGSPRRPH